MCAHVPTYLQMRLNMLIQCVFAFKATTAYMTKVLNVIDVHFQMLPQCSTACVFGRTVVTFETPAERGERRKRAQ